MHTSKKHKHIIEMPKLTQSGMRKIRTIKKKQRTGSTGFRKSK